MLPVPAITLRSSRRLLHWITILYAAAGLLVLYLPVPVLLRLVLLSAVVLDGAWRRREAGSMYGFGSLRVNALHQMQVREHGSEDWLDLELRAPCHLFPGLIIINGRWGHRKCRAILEPGMMDAEAWRSLRIWMKWRLPELLVRRPSVLTRFARILLARWRKLRGG